MSEQDIELDVRLNDYTRALERFRGLTGKTWPEILRKEGRLLAVSFARATQPFGSDERGKLLGEMAVARDIRKVYGTAGDAFKSIEAHDTRDLASAFYAAYKQRKYRKAEKILKGSSSPLRDVPFGSFRESDHLERRDARGKVRGKTPTVILTNDRARNAYIKREQRQVGWAKAGWAVCARLLGGVRGIPQWVTRHRRAPGGIIDKMRSILDPSITLRNAVPYVDKLLPTSARSEALASVRRNIQSEIERMVDKHATRSGLHGH